MRPSVLFGSIVAGQKRLGKRENIESGIGGQLQSFENGAEIRREITLLAEALVVADTHVTRGCRGLVRRGQRRQSDAQEGGGQEGSRRAWHGVVSFVRA